MGLPVGEVNLKKNAKMEISPQKCRKQKENVFVFYCVRLILFHLVSFKNSILTRG